LPRLSVDLDLVFPDHDPPRAQALHRINEAIRQSAGRLKKRGFETHTVGAADVGETKLLARRGRQTVACGDSWPGIARWTSLAVAQPSSHRGAELAVGTVVAHVIPVERGFAAQRLAEAASKLRARGAWAALQALLDEDSLSAATKISGLSERGARRLFERLAALGVIRELTGRPTFRLYGL
jgi:Protein of unknown function (DUF1403)